MARMREKRFRSVKRATQTVLRFSYCTKPIYSHHCLLDNIWIYCKEKLNVDNYRSPLKMLLTKHVLKRFTVTSMNGTERGILWRQRKLQQ